MTLARTCTVLLMRPDASVSMFVTTWINSLKCWNDWAANLDEARTTTLVAPVRRPWHAPLWSVQVKTITQSAEPQMLLLIHQQLKELQECVNVHTSFRARRGKFVHLAERIDRIYFVLYSTTVSIFLIFIFTEWNSWVSRARFRF